MVVTHLASLLLAKRLNEGNGDNLVSSDNKMIFHNWYARKKTGGKSKMNALYHFALLTLILGCGHLAADDCLAYGESPTCEIASWVFFYSVPPYSIKKQKRINLAGAE